MCPIVPAGTPVKSGAIRSRPSTAQPARFRASPKATSRPIAGPVRRGHRKVEEHSLTGGTWSGSRTTRCPANSCSTFPSPRLTVANTEVTVTYPVLMRGTTPERAVHIVSRRLHQHRGDDGNDHRATGRGAGKGRHCRRRLLGVGDCRRRKHQQEDPAAQCRCNRRELPRRPEPLRAGGNRQQPDLRARRPGATSSRSTSPRTPQPATR